ncbi:transposase [Cucumis melo var. makuwa]|uniref:Transposase n=1 Tax=Cucumis melo var. makuwa TaxID=1194695 RepID=A0A5A7VFU0_CUCMM|nr:transposase [Cucumis melo var. makuwa]
MKNVAKCNTWGELQNPTNQRVFECKLHLEPSGRGHVCLASRIAAPTTQLFPCRIIEKVGGIHRPLVHTVMHTILEGYKACPICGEDTSSIRVPYGKKYAYMGHRKYLPIHHPYRRQKKAFDGNQEHGTPPLPLSGEAIYNRLKDKTFPCGKRKSKDGLSSRLDLVEMNFDPSWPVSDGSRTYIPATCYTLSREEISICRTLSDLKVMREIHKGQVVSTAIRWIAHGPHPFRMTYEGYKVNRICYNTNPRDDTRTVQNSGVMFVASTMYVVSAKDKNLIIVNMPFYGGPSLTKQWHLENKLDWKLVARAYRVPRDTLIKPIDESATKIKSFIRMTVRVHVLISYQSWKDLPTELKDKIYELIKKDLEKRKNPPTEYSFIDGEHWNIFVASRLTEQFEDNLPILKRVTHSTDNITSDILSEAIGGNDPPGKIRGVGQYVTLSKYFHTAREKRKKVSKEEDYAE